MSLQAIILAAGEGTRIKSELPKVLHRICGRPMIAYALDLATSVGIARPIVVIGRGADLVKAHLPKEAKAVIQPKRQGTGDAVLIAKRALETSSSGDVLILYADTPLVRRTTIQKLIETHRKGSASCTLLTAHLADPSGYGRIVRNEQGLISGIVEESEVHAAHRTIREVNIGPLICKTQALLDALLVIKAKANKELYLTHIVAHLAQQEGVKISSIRAEEASEALGVNTRSELAKAIGVIRGRIVDSHLQNGVTIEDMQSTFIDHGVSIGVDTVIHPYTVIETAVSIGKRCSIGPFARLRSGVVIGNGVRIGNFAELVRTKVGDFVRINHMSYLGDTTIEDQVNIGAGTITANYDGESKHPTHIGKGAFIGSDTVLIAPVKIGAGATTGAGSVVPKAHDVPPKGVVMGVPARLFDGHGAGKSSLKKVAARKSAGSASRPKARLHAGKAKKRSEPVRTQKTRR